MFNRGLELLTCSIVAALAAAAPAGLTEIAFLPTPLIIYVAIGAGLAVVVIPSDRRSVSLSVTTALAGIGAGLAFTELALQYLGVESAAAAKAVAACVGFSGLPAAGLLTRVVDQATNNPSSWVGGFVDKLIPRQDPQPPAPGTMPPGDRLNAPR